MTKCDKDTTLLWHAIPSVKVRSLAQIQDIPLKIHKSNFEDIKLEKLHYIRSNESNVATY